MTEEEVIEARRNLRLAETLKRNATIEECARELERLIGCEDIDVAEWPAAIRALKAEQENS